MRCLFFLVGLGVLGCSGDSFVAGSTDSGGQDVAIVDSGGTETGAVEGGGSHFCNGQPPPNFVFCEDWDDSPSLPSAWSPEQFGAQTTAWKIETALAISPPYSLHGTFDATAAPADHSFVIHAPSTLSGKNTFTIDFDVRFDSVASGNDFDFLRVGSSANDAGVPFFATASLTSGKIELATPINNQSTNASPQKDTVYHGTLTLLKAGTWQAKLDMGGSNNVQLQVSAATPSTVQVAVGAVGSQNLQSQAGVRIDNILVTSN